jgi:hypothetical protein
VGAGLERSAGNRGSARPIRHHHRDAWRGRVRQRRHPDAYRIGESISGPDCPVAGDQACDQGVQRSSHSATGAFATCRSA